MALKPTKNTSKSSTSTKIVEKSHEDIVKSVHPLACCVKDGNKYIILSEDVDSKSLNFDFCISKASESEEIAWKFAANKVVNG